MKIIETNNDFKIIVMRMSPAERIEFFENLIGSIKSRFEQQKERGVSRRELREQVATVDWLRGAVAWLHTIIDEDRKNLDN